VDTDFFLGWGGLFPLMWVAEHVDVDPWNGFHFGSVAGEEISICNIRMSNGIFAMKVKEGITFLEKDGKVIFQ